MPNNEELKEQIMNKAHQFKHSIHLGSTKIYHSLQPGYWWNMMKNQIVRYVQRCASCQQVKAEHRRLEGSPSVP